MAEAEQPGLTAEPQLGQMRVPLERASEAFETPDASGRTPIVIVPQRTLRLRIDLLGGAVGLVVLAVAGIALAWNSLLVLLALVCAAGLAALGGMSAFFVRVPEGTSALLVRGGRHAGVVGPGAHVLMPWFVVSHLVTLRHIPFELPRIEAPTGDNIGARVEALLTFTIVEPGHFVYAIAAPDFDLVLQAACQDAARSVLRTLTWTSLLDFDSAQADALRERIDAHVEPYGVRINDVNVTYARPEANFLDLQAQLVHAQARGRLTALDSDTQAAQLARLEEQLGRYPRAAEWQWQSEQLGVARDLAANSRTIVQVGHVADLATALLSRELAASSGSDARRPNGPAA